MRFSNEGQFNRWWSGVLEKCNAMVYSAVGGMYGESGWPDRFICHTRWSGWVEGKSQDRKQTRLQRHIASGLIQRRVNVLIFKLSSTMSGPCLAMLDPRDDAPLRILDLKELECSKVPGVELLTNMVLASGQMSERIVDGS